MAGLPRPIWRSPTTATPKATHCSGFTLWRSRMGDVLERSAADDDQPARSTWSHAHLARAAPQPLLVRLGTHLVDVGGHAQPKPALAIAGRDLCPRDPASVPSLADRSRGHTRPQRQGRPGVWTRVRGAAVLLDRADDPSVREWSRCLCINASVRRGIRRTAVTRRSEAGDPNKPDDLP
jgi:hypothetical protein